MSFSDDSILVKPESEKSKFPFSVAKTFSHSPHNSTPQKIWLHRIMETLPVDVNSRMVERHLPFAER